MNQHIQTNIEVEQTELPCGPCRWCGQLTKLQIQIRPSRKTTAKGTVGIVPGLSEWVCRKHKDQLEAGMRYDESLNS